MFKNITDFQYKRSVKEAIGFYIAYLVFAAIISAILGGITGIIVGTQRATEIGLKVGNIIAVTWCLLVSFFILKSKNLHKSFGYLLTLLLSGLLALFGGALLGLIPTAFLTTKSVDRGTLRLRRQ